MDKVRKTENRILLKEGDDALKGTRYLWLTNPSNWRQTQKETFRALKNEKLKTG